MYFSDVNTSLEVLSLPQCFYKNNFKTQLTNRFLTINVSPSLLPSFDWQKLRDFSCDNFDNSLAGISIQSFFLKKQSTVFPHKMLSFKNGQSLPRFHFVFFFMLLKVNKCSKNKPNTGFKPGPVKVRNVKICQLCLVNALVIVIGKM